MWTGCSQWSWWINRFLGIESFNWILKVNLVMNTLIVFIYKETLANEENISFMHSNGACCRRNHGCHACINWIDASIYFTDISLCFIQMSYRFRVRKSKFHNFVVGSSARAISMQFISQCFIASAISRPCFFPQFD